MTNTEIGKPRFSYHSDWTRLPWRAVARESYIQILYTFITMDSDSGSRIIAKRRIASDSERRVLEYWVSTLTGRSFFGIQSSQVRRIKEYKFEHIEHTDYDYFV